MSPLLAQERSAERGIVTPVICSPLLINSFIPCVCFAIVHVQLGFPFLIPEEVALGGSLFCRLVPLGRRGQGWALGSRCPPPAAPGGTEAWDGPVNMWCLQLGYRYSGATRIHAGRSRDPVSGNSSSLQTINQFLGEMLHFLARKFNSRGGALSHIWTEHSDEMSECTLAQG